MPTPNLHLLPKKVYLSGSDCFHLVLDKHAQKHNAGGNVMRQIFYLNAAIDKATIITALEASPLIHWLCNIKLVTGNFFQLPYWLYENEQRTIVVTEHHAQEEKAIPCHILQRDIAIHAERFIEADIIHYPSGKSALLFSWNHILLDGKGTALLFDHINAIAEGKEIAIQSFFPEKEKHPGIVAYIRNMYKVKSFIEASSKAPIASVANRHSETADIGFKRICFSADETKQIEAKAFTNGARFGANHFHIACCLHAVDAINKQRNNSGILWLPVPYDGRMRGKVGPVVSNHVSFLFFRITQAMLGSLSKTMEAIGQQMKDQLQEQMPKKYDMLLRMLRHIPLWLYYFLISKTGEGNFASFLYSTTGDNFNQLKSFMGWSVEDMAIIPAATFPPGLTFIFSKHAGATSIHIAYSKDVISETELANMEVNLTQLLVKTNDD